jgi:hypothetical protein
MEGVLVKIFIKSIGLNYCFIRVSADGLANGPGAYPWDLSVKAISAELTDFFLLRFFMALSSFEIISL